MITKEATGYSKELAFETTGLDVSYDKLKNATIAWKKAGSPLNSKTLTAFAEQYLKSKKAVGAYVVIDGSSSDTRSNPYSVINERTTGKRKAKTTYQIKEGEFKVKETTVVNENGEESVVKTVTGVTNLGAVEATADKKDVAIKLMKELISENKKNYVIEIVKEITEGQKYAAYGTYTPSKSAKQGKFIFFQA